MNLKPIFQVSEFNELINTHLSLLEDITVEGEISELRISQNKWVFITLKDKLSTVSIFGVLFQLRNIFHLEEGMKVRAKGVPKLHQKSGKFSLYAYSINPAGEGELKQLYEKLKQSLTREGIFDTSHKRLLPRIPKQIGLITAYPSQAYSDFIKVSRERLPGIRISLIPIAVQGESAVDSIIKGIELANRSKQFDVLVLTRGGGSLEDLVAFNDEQVTRAVFASQTPIVCAIGHEDNVSLAELAADLRASTPSNAAELVVPTQESIEDTVDQFLGILKSHTLGSLQRTHETLFRSNVHFEKYLKHQIMLINTKISRLTYLLELTKAEIVHSRRNTNNRLSKLQAHLDKHFRLIDYQQKNLVQSLQLLDTQNILKRGFSITRDEQGRIIDSVTKLTHTQRLETEVSDGKILSIIKQPN